MKILNQPLDVKSAKLATPPEGGELLATRGRLLVVWGNWYRVSDRESGEQYHLVFYHPSHGWCACQWDESNGLPLNAYPVSETDIWVATAAGNLIHISLKDEVKATQRVSLDRELSILYAAQDEIWIREVFDNRVMQLRFQANDMTVVKKKSTDDYVSSVYPLEDGAWMMIEGNRGYAIWSPSHEKMICKDKGKVFFHPPFLVQVVDKYYYYTEDPRRGWKKLPIAVESELDHIAFFVKHDDAYYAAVYRSIGRRILLYSLSCESEMSSEYVWEISGYLSPTQFAEYHGLVCIADEKPLVVSSREDVPENHGFLVWNPRLNAFYEDIPQLSIMHAKHLVPHNLQIPTAWLDKDKGQHIRMFDG